jgi:hypothetical protein
MAASLTFSQKFVAQFIVSFFQSQLFIPDYNTHNKTGNYV